MIKITDENRSDLIASCLMEAANIMKENNNRPMEESAGNNGFVKRALEERLKTLEKEYKDKNYEKKIKQYERAGYGDKAKKYIDDMEDLKHRIDYVKDYIKLTDKKLNKKPSDLLYYAAHSNDDDLKKIHSRWTSACEESKASDTNKRINNRAKEAMGESVESHLGFANTLLRVIDD